MNLADPSTSLRMHLCPEGLDLYALFLKQREAYHKFERVHMLLLMIHMHQKFMDHFKGCKLCKEE